MKEAMVRSQKDGMAERRDGEAQGRVDWKRDGWLDAKFEGKNAKWDLGKEQQRVQREERSQKRRPEIPK